MIGLLTIIIFSLILILSIIYLSTINMMGHEVSKRQTLEILYIFSLFIPTYSLFYYFFKNHGLAVLQFLFSSAIIIYLLSSLLQKRKSGILLLDIGKSELWSSQLTLGVMNLGLMILSASSYFYNISVTFSQISLVAKISELSFYGSIGVFLILQSLNKTEFRKSGIWVWLRFIKWERVKSYRWEPSKPNILTIRHKPSFPLFSGWMSFPVPTQYREDVSRILSERLPNEIL
jgi:hypothetical protein